MKPSHYSQCQASHKGNPKSTGIGAVYNGNQLSNPVLHFGSDVAKSLLPHSKEERDRIETANRKAEDEAFVRDSFGIHPDEQPLIQGCIDQINQRLKEAAGLGRKARQLAFEIGVELVGLKEDKVYPGKWTEFCKKPGVA